MRFGSTVEIERISICTFRLAILELEGESHLSWKKIYALAYNLQLISFARQVVSSQLTINYYFRLHCVSPEGLLLDIWDMPEDVVYN